MTIMLNPIKLKKMMTLDEAIQHAQEVADFGCDQCSKDHQQLADWLRELKELRKDVNDEEVTSE